MSKILRSIAPVTQAGLKYIDRNPLRSFIILLATLILLIVIGNLVRSQEKIENPPAPQTKTVHILTVGQAPRLEVSGKIEKSGVIKIVSLTGGIVQAIHKTEGTQIKKGDSLFYISTNYQGANAAQVSRQIAQENYKFITDTYEAQKSLIQTNKQIAENAKTQTQDLANLQEATINGTQSLIDINQTVLSGISNQVSQLQSMNVNGASDSAILQLQMTQSQVKGALNQAQAQVNSARYQSDENKPPNQLANLQKDAAVKLLDIQEKTLGLNKEIAQLNLRLAYIQEALSYPSSPFAGIVERVNVKVGQYVNAGTVLATISSNNQSSQLRVLTSQNIAQNVSRIEPAKIWINGKSIEGFPTYISTEPTDGMLFSLQYVLPEFTLPQSSNDQIVKIELPIGAQITNGYFPYLPLDSIYQTEDKTYAYIVHEKNGKTSAQSKQIDVGKIYGNYVEVLSNLKKGTKVILDRTVIEGDPVKIAL